MELFFYSLQSILAVLGALLVLFARTTQKAFWGFALTLFALLPVVLQNKGPVELLIFGIAAVLICSSFIYLNKSKVFENTEKIAPGSARGSIFDAIWSQFSDVLAPWGVFY